MAMSRRKYKGHHTILHVISAHNLFYSCYLNPMTSFVWSFIVPVILILLVNVGFFIMAMVIKYRHQKRQQSKGKVVKQVR